MRGEVPRLPAVPHQLDVGVVALAGRLRAAGLLVGEVDGVVRLGEIVQAVPARVGLVRVRVRVGVGVGVRAGVRVGLGVGVRVRCRGRPWPGRRTDLE